MKFIKLISSEIFLIIFLSLLSLTAGMSPTIYRYLATPPDRVFSGVEFYSDDYSVYVGAIREGQSKNWLVHDKHTSEDFKGTLIHQEYLLWGKLTGIFKINPILSYHLARFFFGLIFLMVFYYFLRLVFPKNSLARKLAFFFFIAAGSFPIINNNLALNSKWYLSWFMEAETVMRSVALPHYLLGYSFFLLTAIFFHKTVYESKKSGRNFLLAAIFGNLLAFAHPAEHIILYTSLIIYLIVSFINQRKQLILIMPLFIKTLTFIILTCPMLFYFNHEFTKPPWNQAIKQWESQSGFYATITGFKEYALTLGPVFILGTIGIIIFLSKKQPQRTLIPHWRGTSLRGKQATNNELEKNNNSQLAIGNQFTLNNSEGQLDNWLLYCFAWIISHFSLVYLSYPFLKIAPLRFLHNPILIPISIFAAIVIISLSVSLTRVALDGLIIPVICFLVVAISAPVYFNTLKYHFQTYNDFSTLIYPTKEMVKSFDWLSKNTNPNDAVLTAYEAGSLIPFMCGNTVYTGHLWSTINYQEKSQKGGEFFSGQMPPEQAYSFLRKGNIKLIFYGPQEQSAGGKIEKYPFLKEIYQNNEVRIYQII